MFGTTLWWRRPRASQMETRFGESAIEDYLKKVPCFLYMTLFQSDVVGDLLQLLLLATCNQIFGMTQTGTMLPRSLTHVPQAASWIINICTIGKAEI